MARQFITFELDWEIRRVEDVWLAFSPELGLLVKSGSFTGAQKRTKDAVNFVAQYFEQLDDESLWIQYLRNHNVHLNIEEVGPEADAIRRREQYEFAR